MERGAHCNFVTERGEGQCLRWVLPCLEFQRGVPGIPNPVGPFLKLLAWIGT